MKQFILLSSPEEHQLCDGAGCEPGPCWEQGWELSPGLCQSQAVMKTSVSLHTHVCMCAKTLCDPMDYSLPGPLSKEFFRQEYWNG